ncbi:MAG: hypothetical protein QOF33_253 [Thermomicrobiales bacterium]|nr:hypothetical protein [Thermomicrobiales bacterium]MEA2598311.1 hypothetical protein [Thermomicrobiales bacterium]
MPRRLAWLALMVTLLAAPLAGLPSARAQGDGTDPATPSPGEKPPAEEAILPKYRILSYYGFPGNELMGILGQYSKSDLRKELVRQARAYEAADPDRPVKLAFEMMASVAQRDPMPDGSYLTYTDPEIIKEYVDYTAKHDMLLILDVQFGRTSVQEEIAQVRDWLKLPHVHLALDAEFAVKEGEQPGVDLGSLDAKDVQYAQREMVTIAEEAGIPPKILILHQFNYYSVSNKEKITPIDGVLFVLEVDGFGTPDEKRLTYSVMTEEPIQFHGFKLWYSGEDDPLMTPEDVLSLDPIPDIVIYQ